MNKKKLLVIEDDADVRLGYRIRLGASHFDTFFAVDALSGVSQAFKVLPDLILLDLGLPGGDGYVVLEQLGANESLASIPVIVVSARDAVANKQRALSAGAVAFVQKPWNDQELLTLIWKTLEEPRVADRHRRHPSNVSTLPVV